MYVCVCHAITERDIGAAVDRGCCSVRDLREQLGLGSCCGRCHGCARQMLSDSSASRPSAHTPSTLQTSFA